MSTIPSPSASPLAGGAATIPSLDPRILRKYDVRGVCPSNINPDVAYHLGRRFGAFLIQQHPSGGPNPSVVVGYDGRLTSPALAEQVMEGLRAAGCDVLPIGLCPTPLVSFAHATLATDAGIMVTGSHNPPDHNGFKITLNQKPFFDQALHDLNAVEPAAAPVPGTVLSPPKANDAAAAPSVLESYIRRLCQDIETPPKSPKVVWDIGHGAAGAVMPSLVPRLPGEHVLLYETVDGTFPAHHPDPTVADNMQDLQRAVLEHGADVGFAFDGDADRLGVVDDKGRILWADMYLILLAQDILSRQPGATIIADVKASQTLFDQVKKLGGRPLMAPTGHSIIKQKLREHRALLAGEMSGHIFFADTYYGFDDAIYAAVRILRALAHLPGHVTSLSAWFDTLPATYTSPEYRLPYTGNKEALLEELLSHLQAKIALAPENPPFSVSTLDGLRVTYPGLGWWLLRASNTQDLIVLRTEGTSADNHHAVTQDLQDILEPYGIKLP